MVNPTAASGAAGRRWPAVEAALRAAGTEVDTAFTEGPGHARELARAAASRGRDAVAAVGGDGTVHEVVGGLLEGAPRGAPLPSLAVLPLGSGNDFAAALRLPADPLAAARTVTSVPPRPVDAGRVETLDGERRFFANGVGAGFDARVALRARAIPRLTGPALYGTALLWELTTLRTPPLRVRVDGREVHDGPACMVTISNGPRHGGGFHLCPGAEVDDGLLDVLVVEKLSRRRLLSFLSASLKGGMAEAPGIRRHRGREVELRAGGDVPAHVDGEILSHGAHRLRFELLPGRLPVLAPAPRPGGTAAPRARPPRPAPGPRRPGGRGGPPPRPARRSPRT